MTTTGTVSTTSSGTAYVSGIVSELDTDSLIEAAVAQKTERADMIDEQITENEAVIEAYTELQSLLQAVDDSIEGLTVVTSVLDTSSWDTKSAYYSASGDLDPGDVLSVVIDNSAATGSYTVEIKQQAAAMKVSADTVTDKSADLGYAGVFSLGLNGGNKSEITVTSDMSVEEIADSINEQSNTTGITATVIKQSDSTYSLILTGNSTAVEIETSSVSGDDILNGLGITDAAGSFKNIIQAASSAVIELDGIEITRSSNTFDDLIDGIEFTIEGSAEGNTFTLEIDYDYSSVKESIVEFVDAYNALREFVNTNQETNSDGTASDDAVLFSDTYLKSISSYLSDILTGTYTVDDDGTALSLGSLGITFNDDNTIEISDEDTLDSTLLENYDAVRRMFETDIETDNSSFTLLRNNNSMSLDGTFEITIGTDGLISGVSYNGDTSAFTVSGNRIIGAEGTIYEGFQFNYAGDVSASVTMSLTQGLFDKVSYISELYSDSATGLLTDRISDLGDIDDELQTKSDYIRERAEDYRESLQNRYAQMETDLQLAENLLKQIKALFGTDSDD